MHESQTMLISTAYAVGCVGGSGLTPEAKDVLEGETGPCALCGGPAAAFGPAWRRERAIKTSFGPTDSFAVGASRAVCGACAHFAAGSTFQRRVADAGLGAKVWPQASWRSYSHIFAEGRHILPKREDWRAFLLSPPEPPFVAVMATSGQKNLVYRAAVAVDRQVFPVQVEEDSVLVDARAFGGVLADFEAAYNDGFPKDALLSGSYSTSTIMRVGKPAWMRREAALAPHRARHLRLLRLAHTVARKSATAPTAAC